MQSNRKKFYKKVLKALFQGFFHLKGYSVIPYSGSPERPCQSNYLLNVGFVSQKHLLESVKE